MEVEFKLRGQGLYDALMLQHIRQTIFAIESIPEKYGDANKSKALAALISNIKDWAGSLYPDDPVKRDEWYNIMYEHTITFYDYAKERLACQCKEETDSCKRKKAAETLFQKLLDNKVKVVNFLCKLFGEQYREKFESGWMDHLGCSDKYVNAFRDYLCAKKHCLNLGAGFGQLLDTITKEQQKTAPTY